MNKPQPIICPEIQKIFDEWDNLPIEEKKRRKQHAKGNQKSPQSLISAGILLRIASYVALHCHKVALRTIIVIGQRGPKGLFYFVRTYIFANSPVGSTPRESATMMALFPLSL